MAVAHSVISLRRKLHPLTTPGVHHPGFDDAVASTPIATRGVTTGRCRLLSNSIWQSVSRAGRLERS
jgi:hypothetical protein